MDDQDRMKLEDESRRPANSGGGMSPDSEDTGEIEIIGYEAVDENGLALGQEEAASASSSPRKPVATEAEVESLRAELENLQERHIRLLADFDNYRKRRDREAEEAGALGAEAVLKEFLPILDNLERARESLPEGTPRSVRQGIELVHRQMLEAMRRQGLEAIDALGEAFDPRYHEAVAVVPRSDFEDQRVIEELQRGYTFQGRLLRPAMVKVVVNPEGSSGKAGEANDAGDRRGNEPWVE